MVVTNEPVKHQGSEIGIEPRWYSYLLSTYEIQNLQVNNCLVIVQQFEVISDKFNIDIWHVSECILM